MAALLKSESDKYHDIVRVPVKETVTKLGKEKVYFGKVVSDRPVLRSEDSSTPFRVYPPYVSEVGIGLSHDLADFVVNNIDQLAYPVASPSGAGIAMGNWFS